MKGQEQETSHALIAKKKFRFEVKEKIRLCRNVGHVNQAGMFVTDLQQKDIITFDEYLFYLDMLAEKHACLMEQRSNNELANINLH